MKNKVLLLIFFLIILILFIVLVIVIGNNHKLIAQIALKDRTFSDVRKRDSIYREETKKYSDIITKYVNNCEFTIDGKNISTEKLIETFNETFSRNIELKDSLLIFMKLYLTKLQESEYFSTKYKAYKDSSFLYMNLFKLSKRDYGINYEVKKIDDGYNLRRTFTKTDSALLLYPYYKDKLKYDSTSGTWNVTIVNNNSENEQKIKGKKKNK